MSTNYFCRFTFVFSINLNGTEQCDDNKKEAPSQTGKPYHFRFRNCAPFPQYKFTFYLSFIRVTITAFCA